MRKFAVSLLLAGLTASSVLPAYGQKPVCFYKDKNLKIRRATTASTGETGASRIPERRRVAEKTDHADFAKVRAARAPGGKGNLVEWEMAEEKGNLGFYVKRVGDKGTQLVDENLTVGSVGIAANQPLYGQVYRVYDPIGTAGDRYVIETLGAQGESIETEEIPVRSPDTRDGITITQEAISRDLNSGIFEAIEPSFRSSRQLPEEYTKRAASDVSDLTTHRWVVNQPGAKISVRTEGLHKVTLGSLQSASPGTFSIGNTASWRLFREGIEQAVIIGSDAGVPYLEFYGRPIDTRESDTRVYYLIADPITAGKRMEIRPLATTGGEQALSYTATSFRKERTTFIGTIINGEPENWWGRVVTPTPTTFQVITTGIDRSKPNAAVNLKMQGLSQTATPPRVSLKINGSTIGEVFSPFSQSAFSGDFSIPTNLLVEGKNSITLTSVAANNFELFDSLSITYARAFNADVTGRLRFTLPGDQWATVRGFKSERVRAFDLRDADAPVTTGYLPVSRTHDIRWSDKADASTVLSYIVADRGILTPASVVGNTPSHLWDTTEPADLIIISHSDPDFLIAANTWANYRRSQGFSVAVVDIADILDEFNYGSSSAKAIKDFLQYAHTNWPAISQDKQYVLLLGDASTDPKNYAGWGYFNQVPMTLVQTIYSETGSDDALADFNGDGLSEMAVGRIPFREAAAISAAYDKTVTFESTPALQNVNRGAVLAYDKPNGYDFFSMSQDLATYLPAATPKAFVGFGLNNTNTTDPNARPNLIAALNSGKYLVNYSGHGAQSTWSSTAFFSNAAVNNELANGQNYSIYMMLTCLNGYFVGYNGLNDDSIAELLLKKTNAGGPAAWASTGLTTADVQMMMGRQFVSHIGIGDIPRMGDLIRDAKAVIPAGADVRFSWALFGDLMLKVR